jgi:hypothetical protein
MITKKRKNEIRKRWNILNDNSGGFIEFKNRVYNILKDFNFSEDDHINFCNYYGIINCYHGVFGNSIIRQKLYETVLENDYFELLEVVFSLKLEGEASPYEYIGKNSLYKKVCEAIEFSDINLSVKKTDNGDIIFYPRGEEFLDDNLINDDIVLSFLDKKTSQHFIDALNFYKNKKWVKSTDSLRRCLEEFLRVKLKNSKGLKANTSEIGEYLKKIKNPSQIRNIISQIFGYLDQYFNDNSKHNDGNISEVETEFLIYQVSLLMRYISKSR